MNQSALHGSAEVAYNRFWHALCSAIVCTSREATPFRMNWPLGDMARNESSMRQTEGIILEETEPSALYDAASLQWNPFEWNSSDSGDILNAAPLSGLSCLTLRMTQVAARTIANKAASGCHVSPRNFDCSAAFRTCGLEAHRRSVTAGHKLRLQTLPKPISKSERVQWRCELIWASALTS